MTDELLAKLSKCTFIAEPPGAFCKCESAVFTSGGTNSLCYTTSTENAEVLAAILNEWASLRRANQKTFVDPFPDRGETLDVKV